MGFYSMKLIFLPVIYNYLPLFSEQEGWGGMV
jgi:hypothetical protein